MVMPPPKLLLVVGIAAIAAAIAWLDYSHGNALNHALNEAKSHQSQAPNFSFSPIDSDANHQLTDFKSKTVLVNFWASWCPPCLHEYPLLMDLARQHPEKLAVIMISSDKNANIAYQTSREIYQQHGNAAVKTERVLFPDIPNLYVAWDEGKHITRDIYGTSQYPESILITPNGRISQKITGPLTEKHLQEIGETLRMVNRAGN